MERHDPAEHPPHPGGQPGSAGPFRPLRLVVRRVPFLLVLSPRLAARLPRISCIRSTACWPRPDVMWP